MGVDGDQFVLRPMLAGSQSLSFSYGRSLREMRLSASLEGIPASLAVTGWNVSQKQAVNASAGLSSQSGETFGLVTGGEISGAALDAWQHINLADWPVAPSAAQHTADAAFRQSARDFVQGEGLCDLHPGLVPAGLVHLEQLGPWFSGAYRVTKVQHSFSPQSGYETRFWVERPGLAGGREILPLRNKAGKPRRTTKTKKARMPRRRRPE
jgi:uncharacterized protein